VLAEFLMRSICTINSERLVPWLQNEAPSYRMSLSFAANIRVQFHQKLKGILMLKKYIATVLFLCALWPLSAAAAPSLRYQTNMHGDFVMIGGPLAQDCSAATPTYGTVSNCTGQSSDGSADYFWRADQTPPTAASANTSAQANTTLKLTLPTGAVVVKAYVYWLEMPLEPAFMIIRQPFREREQAHFPTISRLFSTGHRLLPVRILL